MSEQIPSHTYEYLWKGETPKRVHLFDRYSPLSSIDGKQYYMCGEQHSIVHPYYEVSIAFEIGLEGPLPVEGYERCPKCWNRDDMAFAMLAEIP